MIILMCNNINVIIIMKEILIIIIMIMKWK